MKWITFVYERLLPPVLWALIHVFYNTLRIRSIGEETVRELRQKGQRVVFAFWHGHSFFLIKHMSRRGISIIASPSRDGRLLADVLRLFHYGIIPGSSDKSPVRSIIQSVRAMRAGQDMAIAVDGPRGPRHKMKPGALFIAKKMKAPIVVGVNSSFPSWTFRSWDRFVLPRPFARSVMAFSKPIQLSPDLSEESIQNEIRIIESELNRLTLLADRITGYSGGGTPH